MTATVTNEHLRRELDNFEKKGEFGNLLEELKYSTLIAPFNAKGTGCAMVTIAGENYIPLFTDIHEYNKAVFTDGLHPEAFDFNFYLEQLKNGLHGFIVNVESERFPITDVFLNVIETDYTFDLDFEPFTQREIRKIYDSIDNTELEEFLENPQNRWNLESIMELLNKSHPLTVVFSKKSLDGFEQNGAISLHDVGGVSYSRTCDRFALLYSSPERIQPSRNGSVFRYSQLVNLGVFIDHLLKSDLDGIRLDDDIIISRDFLIDYMKDFTCPCIDKYDDYVFRI